MRRTTRFIAVVATALVMVATLAACGADSPAKADSSASATPTASPTPPVPPQPEGDYGVTFTVVNWDAYATNPVVLAWKKTLEAFYGSVLARDPNAEFLDRTSGAQRRLWMNNINYAREHDLVGAAKLKGKVARVKIQGNTAILLGCDLRETTNFRPRGKKYDGGEHGYWQMRNTFKKTSGHWVMTDSADRGRCPKGV